MADTQIGVTPMPTIRLGDLEVSRLILGSNPFFGFAHKPDDTGARMCRYYTQEGIMQTMDEAAAHGITAAWAPSYDHWIDLWSRYQDQGGKLMTWIGQPDPEPERMDDAISVCADNGGRALCIQGERVDHEARTGHWDTIVEWLDHIHSLGLPAGIAAHRPETHLVAEEKGVPTDFYHQCLYQPENYSDECREQALATIEQIAKPVVAYKVLAAGRLAPERAFRTVMGRLEAKDGLCVGVFPEDDPGQAEQLAGLVRELSGAA